MTTVKDFFRRFPTDAACLRHLFDIRYGQGHECPKCRRAAKWYPLSDVRAYSCQWCGHHLHPTAGTIFQDSRTSLQSWFYAIYLFTTTRHGVSAKELQRQLGVTYKCAWRMGLQIRQHMATAKGSAPLSGVVEIDEVMVGGRQKGKHKPRAAGKTILLGMTERGGAVTVKAVPNARKDTILPVIERHVAKGSEVHTDRCHAYHSLTNAGYAHRTVNHSTGEHVIGDCHVNSIEGFWFHLQKAIRGTHVHVSGKHLGKYADEFSYRYNRRKTPEVMFPELLAKF